MGFAMARKNGRPRALITGSSSGIGLELAKIFAEEGHDLILTSDNRAKLEAAAAQLKRGDSRVDVKIIVSDLAKPGGAKKLYAAAKRAGPIDVLVNNAGRGVFGDFTKATELDDELSMIQLNISSLVALTKLVAPDMRRRGSGRILFTASEASLAPLAMMSVYAATKAFVYSFALSLREELKDTGVTVTALLPGATSTNFFNRAGMMKTKLVKEGGMADAAEVARAGYDAMMNGDDHVVSPLKERIQYTLTKVLPDRMLVQRIE
jgi:short-subunit dehydrogenase